LVFAASSSALGQETKTNSAARIYRDRVEPHWFANNDKFWYRLNLPSDKREFILVDAVKGLRAPAFDHDKLATAMSDKLNERIDPSNLPIDNIKFSADEKTLLLFGTNRSWRCNLESYELSDAPREDSDEKANDKGSKDGQQQKPSSSSATRSPDGHWTALVQG